MSNWFAGINQATSGLDAARYGLNIVSQNIANADTAGYTRQVSNQVSVDGTGTVGLYSVRTGQASLGGVRVASTDRSDDPVLDNRVRNEHARGALTDTAASQLSDVEGVFPEPSDNGLATQLGDFWTAWSGVANDPGPSLATRNVLLQKAGTVAATLHTMSASLGDVVSSTSASLDSDIATANSVASQLAALNNQIAASAATGADNNSLLDTRDLLLDKLATTVGATAVVGANGTATVSVGGQTLVSGSTAAALSVDSSYQVSVGGTAVTLSSSSAAARVSALTTTLPGYQSRLDAVADSLASAVNGVQATGYDLSGAAGTPLFTGSGAAGITVALTDPAQIAASGAPGGNLDGSNALAASKLGAAATGPDAAYASLVGDVAAASALAQQQQLTQSSVVANVDNLKSSVSGVSYDEEVSTMLTYQHAFAASSRVLTTLDDMLDTLINHTGRVGLA